MITLTLLKIITLLSINLSDQFPEELNVIKPFLFNAPVENFDSTSLNFFKNDSSFNYQFTKGEYSVISNGIQSDAYFHDFYFSYHPVFNKTFDTGRIIFYYPERNGRQHLFSIMLQLNFSTEQECSNAYSIITKKLKNLPARKDLENHEAILWQKDEFDYFTHLYFSFRKETVVTATTFYELTLQGKQ